MPFAAEGTMRRENAERGLEQLRRHCDTTAVVENDRLLELVPDLPLEAAFKVADEILTQSIKGMTELVTKPGLVNIDYSDLLTIIEEGGVAMIGIGEARGEVDRVDLAVEEALQSPLLGEVDVSQVSGFSSGSWEGRISRWRRRNGRPNSSAPRRTPWLASTGEIVKL